MNMVSLETEIRKLRPANLSKLAELLSPHLWKTVMGNIKKPGTQVEPMFTSEHVAMIETAATKQRKSASEIFLDEWGTMGRERPTIGTTIELLVETELFRAADYLAVEVMKGTPPNRPAEGPAAAIQIPAEIVGEYNQRGDSSDEDYRSYRNVIESLDNHNADNSTFSHCSSDDIAIIEGQFFEASSRNQNQIANVPSRTSTDLINFSLNEMSTEMKWDENGRRLDGGLNPTNGINNLPTPISLLPNLSALGLGPEPHQRIQEDVPACHLQNYPREVSSSELPLCINDRTVLSPYKESARDSDHHISYTNSLVSHTNTSDSSDSCNSPAMLMQPNVLRQRENDIRVYKSARKNLTNYDELPLTVVELCRD